MKEDDLVSALIEHHNQDDEFEVEFYPERQYQNYGFRGVVDLYEVEYWTTSSGPKVRNEHLYEIKGPAALESATGANQIVRQFNKMCSNFYADPSNQTNHFHSATFELCFLPTENLIRHVWKNRAIYQQLRNTPLLTPNNGEDSIAIVTIRAPTPERIRPVHVSDRYDDLEIWLKHAEQHNPSIADVIRSANLS